jgi:2-polyprenyl-3-methyl-5-hydroxy-6-metoxy-1,4-benzoquinol methylase
MPETYNKIYWSERLSRHPDLRGTGYIGAPLAWQLWSYRSKERAYLKLLKRTGVEIQGLQVLDFGCGVGYFEDFWENLGAHRADGLDIVSEIIERLKREHPDRKYVCADISKDPSELAVFGSPQLVTAIDVLYHIVDDDLLLSTLSALTSIIPLDGYLLFNDVLEDSHSAPHVRHRSLDQWLNILVQLGLEFVNKEPLYAINNRVPRAVSRMPWVIGAIQYYLDFPVLGLFPWTGNNWAILARRMRILS